MARAQHPAPNTTPGRCDLLTVGDKRDPLGAAAVAVGDLEVLLDAMRAVTRDGVEPRSPDPILTLTSLAYDECERIGACLEILAEEIFEGRMPAQPGTPGQYHEPKEEALHQHGKED